MPTLASGQYIAGPVSLYTPPDQHIEGGPLAAAARTTIEGQQQESLTAHELGAGQSGGKHKKKKKQKGGLNAYVPQLPEAHTIDGISHENVAIDAVDILNKLNADAAYDTARTLPAYEAKSGGKRTRRKLNGRHHRRTRRRRNHKSSSHRRRSRRSVLKSLGKV